MQRSRSLRQSEVASRRAEGSGSRFRCSAPPSQVSSTWRRTPSSPARSRADSAMRIRASSPMSRFAPRTAGSRSRRRTTACSCVSARRSDAPSLLRTTAFGRTLRACATESRSSRRSKRRSQRAQPRNGSQSWARRACRPGRSAGVLEALRAAAPATVRVEHPSAGELELVAPPFALESSPLREAVAPPLLGQHTREVLTELGLEATRIAQLEAAGVVAQAPA